MLYASPGVPTDSGYFTFTLSNSTGNVTQIEKSAPDGHTVHFIAHFATLYAATRYVTGSTRPCPDHPSAWTPSRIRALPASLSACSQAVTQAKLHSSRIARTLCLVHLSGLRQLCYIQNGGGEKAQNNVPGIPHLLPQGTLSLASNGNLSSQTQTKQYLASDNAHHKLLDITLLCPLLCDCASPT